MAMRLKDSSDAQSLHSGATMVVQLRCPDALKALPCLTGHENVPSAHFGHRALRTFNWTITHEEKKTKSYHRAIIRLRRSHKKPCGFSCFRSCGAGGLFARGVQVAMTPVPMCCGWTLSLGHTQRLSARRSCFLVRRAACHGLQSPGNCNAAKQKTGAGFGLQPSPAAGLQLTATTTGNQEGLTSAVVFPHNSGHRPSPPEKATNLPYFE